MTTAKRSTRDASGFETRGKRLIATFRVTLDPADPADQAVIKCLSELHVGGGSWANLVHTALSTVLYGQPAEDSLLDLQVERLTDRSGVEISEGRASKHGESKVVVYRTQIQGLITRLFQEMSILNNPTGGEKESPSPASRKRISRQEPHSGSKSGGSHRGKAG